MWKKINREKLSKKINHDANQDANLVWILGGGGVIKPLRYIKFTIQP